MNFTFKVFLALSLSLYSLNSFAKFGLDLSCETSNKAQSGSYWEIRQHCKQAEGYLDSGSIEFPDPARHNHSSFTTQTGKMIALANNLLTNEKRCFKKWRKDNEPETRALKQCSSIFEQALAERPKRVAERKRINDQRQTEREKLVAQELAEKEEKLKSKKEKHEKYQSYGLKGFYSYEPEETDYFTPVGLMRDISKGVTNAKAAKKTVVLFSLTAKATVLTHGKQQFEKGELNYVMFRYKANSRNNDPAYIVKLIYPDYGDQPTPIEGQAARAFADYFPYLTFAGMDSYTTVMGSKRSVFVFVPVFYHDDWAKFVDMLNL